MMYLYVNGEIVHREEARISPFDHGFMYGLGAFETFRTYNGHPFLLDDHLARLNNSLAEMNIRLSLQREEVVKIVHQLLQTNGLKDAYVRLNVSAGIGDIGLQTDGYVAPVVIVYMKPLPSTVSMEKVCTVLKTRRNSPEGKERWKSHHYLNNILGKREIGNDPRVEGIFLNEQGFVTEGIVSNLFWVKDGIVYTPSIDTGALNGITRQFVLSLLTALQIRYEEGLYRLPALEAADELFLTNSIQEIVPVVRLHDRCYVGKEGAVTKKLKKYYERYVTHLWTRHELIERVDL